MMFGKGSALRIVLLAGAAFWPLMLGTGSASAQSAVTCSSGSHVGISQNYTTVTIPSGSACEIVMQSGGAFIGTNINVDGSLNSGATPMGIYVADGQVSSILINGSVGLPGHTLTGLYSGPSSSLPIVIFSVENYGRIEAAQAGIANAGYIGLLHNKRAGTIRGDLVGGIYNFQVGGHPSVGIIEVLINEGIIQNSINSLAAIINEIGSKIVNFHNAQGSSASPLAFSGQLPEKYFIIIRSPSDYGQLLAEVSFIPKIAPAGGVRFGLSQYSTGVVAGTYTGVLQGITAADLDPTTLSGTYGRFAWELIDPENDNIWDLILRILGPDAGRTLIVLQENAGAVRSVINMRASAAVNALEYDCSVFDRNGFCVTVGARYGQVGSNNNEFAGLVTAAYRLSPQVRIGAFLDQTIGGDVPDGLRMRSRSPLFGGFVVYEQNANLAGLRLRASVSYQEGRVRITRRELADTEPGEGTGDLRSFGFGVEASYGFRVAQGWTMAPYGGVRRVESTRNRYTESTSDAVEFPISYDGFGQYVTSAIAGVRVHGALTDRVTLVAGAGMEYDLTAKMDGYAGTSNIPDLERFSINMGQNANEFRGVGSVGVRYNVASNQQLMVDAGVRQTPYSNYPSFSTMLRYAVGF